MHTNSANNSYRINQVTDPEAVKKMYQKDEENLTEQQANKINDWLLEWNEAIGGVEIDKVEIIKIKQGDLTTIVEKFASGKIVVRLYDFSNPLVPNYIEIKGQIEPKDYDRVVLINEKGEACITEKLAVQFKKSDFDPGFKNIKVLKESDFARLVQIYNQRQFGIEEEDAKIELPLLSSRITVLIIKFPDNQNEEVEEKSFEKPFATFLVGGIRLSDKGEQNKMLLEDAKKTEEKKIETFNRQAIESDIRKAEIKAKAIGSVKN